MLEHTIYKTCMLTVLYREICFILNVKEGFYCNTMTYHIFSKKNMK